MDNIWETSTQKGGVKFSRRVSASRRQRRKLGQGLRQCVGEEEVRNTGETNVKTKDSRILYYFHGHCLIPLPLNTVLWALDSFTWKNARKNVKITRSKTVNSCLCNRCRQEEDAFYVNSKYSMIILLLEGKWSHRELIFLLIRIS